MVNPAEYTEEDLVADVSEQHSLPESIEALLRGIRVELRQILDEAKLSSKAQAKIDALFKRAEEVKHKIADAMLQNTPHEGVGTTMVEPEHGGTVPD